MRKRHLGDICRRPDERTEALLRQGTSADMRRNGRKPARNAFGEVSDHPKNRIEHLAVLPAGEPAGCLTEAGARFLDLFAGTGSVGIEAMSRGASEVYWIEGDRGVAKTTLRNVSEIVGSDAEFRVVCSDVMRWIRSVGRNMAFDIVFADPPYADAKQDGCDGGLVDGGVRRKG